MRRSIDYTDETREDIIAEQMAQGFILVEDQRHFDGNHLVFKTFRNPLDEIDTLKVRVEKLEK